MNMPGGTIRSALLRIRSENYSFPLFSAQSDRGFESQCEGGAVGIIPGAYKLQREKQSFPVESLPLNRPQRTTI